MLSISCENNKINQTAKPKNLLNRQQMAAVISDIQLAESAVTQKNMHPDTSNMTQAGYYDFIYKKHAISKEDFEGSYQYYISTPDEMDSIYTVVLEILNRQESEIRGKNVQSMKDSVSRINVTVN